MNPKLVISNYYDSLIRELDIFIEQQLATFSGEDLLEKPVVVDFSEKQKAHNNNSKEEDGKEEDETSQDESGSHADLGSSCDEIWGDRYGASSSSTLGGNSNRLTRQEKAFADPYSNRSIIANSSSSFSSVEWPQEPIKVVHHLDEMRENLISEVRNAQIEAFKLYELTNKEIRRNVVENSSCCCDQERMEILRQLLVDNLSIFSVSLGFQDLSNDEFRRENEENEADKKENDRDDEKSTETSSELLVVLDFYLSKEHQKALKYLFFVI